MFSDEAVPEVQALHQAASAVRIPPSENVPLSPRVRRIIDSLPMRRLASISQLGMVALVYPGATHSRLEHSLGVYYNALRLLDRFSGDTQFESFMSRRSAEAFVMAALVHDIGHWPFCHPIEDMRLSELEDHEARIGDYLTGSDLGRCLEEDWVCELEDVLALLQPNDYPDRVGQPQQFFSSCLSGPIDIDKLDYLGRDSLHAGVPYGRNFDEGRLFSSMCVNPHSARLAISDKGRTAAEMMVFARYIMFSEVYWHHAVRSATAMLQRAVMMLRDRFDLVGSLQLPDANWIDAIRLAASGTEAQSLTDGLFGSQRRLYKRIVEFNVIDGANVHQSLARKPYESLVGCSDHLADRISNRVGRPIGPAELLIDAPPEKLEVDINIDVVGRDSTVRTLGEVSPVVAVLAKQQFDNHVKRVRVFVSDKHRALLDDRMNSQDWADELMAVAADSTSD